MRQLDVGEPGRDTRQKVPIGFAQGCSEPNQLAPSVNGIVQAPGADTHLAFVVGAHFRDIVARFSLGAPMKK